MSVIERNGSYGTYYGSPTGTSSPCTTSQQQTNALYIYGYLTDKGWTLNAIAGLLGNMQVESSINPGRWQNDDVDNTSLGYSLVQWTPTTKYTNWCAEQGYTDPSAMDSALARIIYEVENGLQWIPTGQYNYTFEEFTTSNLTSSELAKAFLLNYERPADQSSSAQNYRAQLASAWYAFLGSEEPPEPEPEPEVKKRKRKRYNFILFNKKRRAILNGQRKLY